MLIKQEWLYQNEVNYSLVSICNCKWLILGEKEFIVSLTVQTSNSVREIIMWQYTCMDRHEWTKFVTS